MPQKIALASMLFSTVLATQALYADQVTLKNGDRLTGDIVSSDGKTLTLKSPYAGTVAIQWDAVQEVSSGQPLYLRSKTGNVAVGAVSTRDGKLAVQTAESGAVAVPKDDVVSIRNKEQEDAAAAGSRSAESSSSAGLLERERRYQSGSGSWKRRNDYV